MHRQKLFKQLVIALSVLLLGFYSSCSKSPKCWGGHKNKGIIENSAQIVCEPFSIDLEFVIRDDSSYAKTFADPGTGLLTCELPAINFDNSSLLGYFGDGQCEVKFIREVTRDENEKNFHYYLIIKSCGACKKNSYSFNWVVVPRIPEDWTVTFEKENR